MKIFISPNKEFDFCSVVKNKAAVLQKITDKKFLFISGVDPNDCVTWILACFHSPLVAVPVSPYEPNTHALEQLFPKNSVVRANELTPENVTHDYRLLKRQPNELWAVLFSSGSTGIPKALAFTGEALENAATAHKQHLNFSGLWLLNLPLFHIGGFSVLTRAYFNNDSVGLSSNKFDPTEVLRWIESGSVNGISLVPTTLFRLLQNKPKAHKNLTHVLLGGAPAEQTLVDQAIQSGFPILRTYGATETCSQIATERYPNAGMQALPGVELIISAENEILVKTKSLCAGQFLNGVLKPLPLANGFYATGDLGEITPQLKIFGRRSDLIISGGVNVFPAEIEQYQPPNILEFAVAGIKSLEWGEIVCGAYVTKNPTTPSQLNDYLQKKIDRRKLPKFWLKLDSIPRTATGKINRDQLRQLFEKNFSNL